MPKPPSAVTARLVVVAFEVVALPVTVKPPRIVEDALETKPLLKNQDRLDEPVEDAVLVVAELVGVLPSDPHDCHDGRVLLARGVDADHDRALVPRLDQLHRQVAEFVEPLAGRVHASV